MTALGYSSPDTALAAYLAALASAGVAIRSGDCESGKPGDDGWTPGDGQWGPGGVEPDRHGCLVAPTTGAEALALCGNGVFLSVGGRTSDLKALYAWAERFPAAALKAGSVSTPSPPGICYGGWGA